ncbi:MAG: phosphoserine phosphatase SerB [Bifidobacteriaceae bacterium]|jgi:phosphoserine phosphatase|nr:phosphoserine phosphatase SerB [Bifidobacteriaceae bacterium]
MTETLTPKQHFVVMDVDSTLIEEEVIDLIAEIAGVGPQISAITEKAMRGDIDFHEALAQRVSMLAGVPTTVFLRVLSRVHFTPGALKLVRTAHKRGWKVGVVSGGFHEIVDTLVAQAGIDFSLANRLEVTSGTDSTVSTLTGRTAGPVVDKSLKLATLTSWVHSLGLELSDAVALGDGANDIPMLQAAGLGIAFCAKPVVREAVSHHIDTRNLMQAIDIIDAWDAQER